MDDKGRAAGSRVEDTRGGGRQALGGSRREVVAEVWRGAGEGERKRSLRERKRFRSLARSTLIQRSIGILVCAQI